MVTCGLSAVGCLVMGTALWAQRDGLSIMGSTSLVQQTVLAGAANAAMEIEPAQELDRILSTDECVAGRMQPIVGARQQEAQSRAARQQRQDLALMRRQRPRALIALQQRPPLGD